MSTQTQGTGSNLRGMLLEVYRTAFGKLPQAFMETEEILREIVHQLSHHDWPRDLDRDDLLDCLFVAREELEMEQFLCEQALKWVATQLNSIPAGFDFWVSPGEVREAM